MARCTLQIGPACFRLQLSITVDGKDMVVGTDGTWVFTGGPVLANSEYNGETYNASMETPGWTTASFTPAAPWSAVSLASGTWKAPSMRSVVGSAAWLICLKQMLAIHAHAFYLNVIFLSCFYGFHHTHSALTAPRHITTPPPPSMRNVPPQPLGTKGFHLDNATLDSMSFAPIDVIHEFTAKWWKEPYVKRNANAQCGWMRSMAR